MGRSRSTPTDFGRTQGSPLQKYCTISSTMTMNYNTALLVGRFQPFHNGHLYLIKKALLSADKIIIGIGSANVIDENNPYSITARQQIIERVIRQEKLKDKVEQIIWLDDFHNDEKWTKQIKEKANKFDLVVGNNEWTNRILEKAGYPILRVKYYQRYRYEGEKIRQLMREGKKWQNRVPAYLIPICRDVINHVSTIKYQYKHLVIGGTFDRLHLGHQNFILRAFQLAEKVMIGITSDLFIKDKKVSQQIISLADRQKTIKDFLMNNRIQNNRYSFSVLDNIFGITKAEKNINAILVTQETKHNAIIINKFRRTAKLTELKIEIMPLIKSEDNKIIRSQRIRFGEIDRNGKVYGRMFKEKLQLPDNLRESLRKPIGKVYLTVGVDLCVDPNIVNKLIITVGDIVSQELEKQKIIPTVKIIDLYSRRQPIRRDVINHVSTMKKIINPPGYIYPLAVKAIYHAIIKHNKTNIPQTVLIRGEEDLLTLPAILLAPLGTMVLYGQKDVGAVMVEVTEEIKQKISNIIKQFTVIK